MELKMNEVAFPEVIKFNFEELQQEITNKVEVYKNLVYTDETIKEAKADKAALNKFIKALEDKRKDIKKQCLKPYEEFEAQIKQLVAIVNEPVMLIDTQVKDYEQRKKDEKLAEIKAHWETVQHPDWLMYNQIYDPKWLNVTVSMNKVKEAIEGKLADIDADIKTIENLPEFSFEALECYKQTLDLNKAIAEGQRLADIQKRKAAAEEAAKNVQPEPAPKVAIVAPAEPTEAELDATVSNWIRFEAQLTVNQAMKLKEFFEINGIKFRAI